MSITFLHPQFLLLIFIIPIIFLVHSWSSKLFRKRALKFANFEAISKIKGVEFFSSDMTKLYITMLILILLTFSLSGMNYNTLKETSISSYVLVLDASLSMDANDVFPTRFDVAKEAALEFIDSAPPGTKIGLVSFSGVPYIESEIKEDKLSIKSILSSVNVKSIGGSNILDSLITASNLLKGEEAKAIILISDGQLNLHSINEIINYTNTQNVIVYTIGIGTKEGGSTSINYISKIDEEALNSIAYNTQGRYFHVASKQDASNAFSEIIKKIEKKHTINLSPYLLFIVFVLIFIEWFLSSTRFRGIP